MTHVPSARRAALRRRLLAWYDAGHRDLPWRFPQGKADPYRVWLAEVMLQQTQVAAVIPYYERFLARYPTLGALAAARDDDVFALFSGLGYYARCRNLLAAAREAHRLYGRLPASIEALSALPGFGPYTTGAVGSIAFGLSIPAVDGNVTRVLCRLFALDGDPADPQLRREVGRLAADLVPARGERPGDFNQALMDLGATLCTRSDPRCEDCPLARLCRARRQGRARELPRPRSRARRKELLFACALVERKGAILLTRRAGRGLFGGLWELPNVELVRGARPRRALREALIERLGLHVHVGSEAGIVRRTLTHRELTLRAFACRVEGDVRTRGPPAVRWAARAQLAALGISAAMRALLSAAWQGS